MTFTNKWLVRFFTSVSILLASLTAASQHTSEFEALNREADSYAKQGNFPQAIDADERLLRATEHRFGPHSLEVANAVGLLGRFHYYARHKALADELFRRQIDILKAGPDHGGSMLIDVLGDLGSLYLRGGHFKDADLYLNEARELAEQHYGRAQTLAYVYNNLGRSYLDARRYEAAEPFFKAALDIRTHTPGIDKDLLAISYDNLGNVYLSMDRLADAEQLLLKALSLFREALGDTDPDTIICSRNVAQLYALTDRRDKAIDLLSTILASVERGEAASPSSVRELLHHRGELYLEAYNLSNAEADLLKALAIGDANEQRSDDERVVRILLALARTYEQSREYEKGDAILARAQEQEESAPAPNWQSISLIYSRRGWFQTQLKNWISAEHFLQRALDINKKEGDSHDRATAIALNNLAATQAFAGKLQEARATVKQAIEINEKLAPEGVDLAENYNNLGSVLERLGQPDLAEPEYRRSQELFARALGSGHSRTINAAANLARLLMTTGNSEEALKLAKLRADKFEERLLDLLAIGSERQGLLFVRAENPFSLLGTFGAAAPLAEVMIKYKGAVTDAVFQRRAMSHGSEERKKAAEGWRLARRKLTEWILLHPSEMISPSDRTRRNELGAELELAESKLRLLNYGGPRLDNARFNISVADIQRRIPSGTVLIDFIRYSHFLTEVKQEDRYGAIVLGSRAPPRWIPLGKAWEIEQIAEAAERAILGSDPVTKIPATLHALHRILIGPILPTLPTSAKRLLISPDGALNFVPFAALLDSQERFLAERFTVIYLTNARALLRSKPTQLKKEVVIYSDPTFRLLPRSTAVPSNRLFTGLRLPELAPLPFSTREALALQKIATRNAWRVTHRKAHQASEADLRTVSKPGILHLATHGFHLPEWGTKLVLDDDASRAAGGIRARPVPSDTHTEIDAKSKETPTQQRKPPLSTADMYRLGIISEIKMVSYKDVVLSDPMLRGAVAMAGAQDTLENWRQGVVYPMDNDGIVNAEEATTFDLQGTWIATLSTCDSGKGEFEPGEGILGLQRGFLLAGAQNVLTTLWPVSDALTPRFMTSFYQQAFTTRDASQALADVQRRFLVQLRKQYGVDAAVRLDGGFGIISQYAR